MMLIQETKLSRVDEKFLRKLGGSNEMQGQFSLAEGTFGGLISMWKDGFFQLETPIISRRYVLCKGRLKEGGLECVIENVYAPNDDNERARFWEELKEIKDSYLAPWILGGDFNTIRQPEEKIGSVFNFSATQSFSNFIENLHLIGLPMTGARFTWGRMVLNSSFSRLGRFLIHAEVLLKFLDLIQIVKPRSLSDHNPVVLESIIVNWGPKPFKFFNYWYERKGFQFFLKEKWEGIINCSKGKERGIFFYLRQLKTETKRWVLDNNEADHKKIENLEKKDPFEGGIVARINGVEGAG